MAAIIIAKGGARNRFFSDNNEAARLREETTKAAAAEMAARSEKDTQVEEMRKELAELRQRVMADEREQPGSNPTKVIEATKARPETAMRGENNNDNTATNEMLDNQRQRENNNNDRPIEEQIQRQPRIR